MPVIPPQQLLRTLRDRHQPGLSRRQLQVLATCELGYTVPDVASGLGIADATVRRHLAELEARILGPTGLWGTHLLLSKWSREHAECCMRPANSLIESHQIFDRRDQPQAS
jgi:hypothetical protein